jgi:hypothetical protein
VEGGAICDVGGDTASGDVVVCAAAAVPISNAEAETVALNDARKPSRTVIIPSSHYAIATGVSALSASG